MQSIDFASVVDQLKPFLPQYLQEHGIDVSKKFLCLYPDHNDTNPSCGIIGKDKPRTWCLGCNRGLDIVDACVLLEKKPAFGIEWIEDTLKYLAKKYGIDVPEADLTEEQIYELDTYRAYRAASLLIQSTEIIQHNETYKKEVQKRKWKTAILADEHVGVVQSFDHFYNALLQQGFSRKFLFEVDLNRKDIFNENNLLFTWKDEKGRPIGFTARNMKFEQEKAEAAEKGEKYQGKKYCNQRTTGLKCNIFQKGRRLYGIDKAIKSPGSLYVFEGQADVITARTFGLPNCVALAGCILHEDHIQLLKQLGLYDIVLVLDGDEVGQQKLAEALETKFAGNRDMRVRVVILPHPEDPDSFIRANGIDAFKELAHWTAFEWRLNQYSDETDESEICSQMIPFIVNESSPIVRDKLARTLAKRTGIDLKVILAELNQLLDNKAHKQLKERQQILDQAMFELRRDPERAEIILQNTQNNILELVRQHDTDSLSNEDFVRALDEQKLTEEKESAKDNNFKLGKDFTELQEALRGDWQGTFMCIGGKENQGKTAFLAKLAYSIAQYNNDAVVIYHTIDDTAEQIVSRLVAIAVGDRKLSLNMVRQPLYWSEIAGVQQVVERRDVGYSRVRELAQAGRLIVKDIHHGSSLPFMENLICYYQDKFPNRRLVYFLDNFHKLQDFEGKGDERVRFKALSESTKGIALRHNCTIIGSAEYTKLMPGIKPTNHNLAETVQISYDANAIIHIYNEVADCPESFTICHEDLDWRGQNDYLPRVEFIIGKNKISEIKKSFFMDFWPASSDYRSVDQKTVLDDSKAMKQNRRDGAFGKEVKDEELSEVF